MGRWIAAIARQGRVGSSRVFLVDWRAPSEGSVSPLTGAGASRAARRRRPRAHCAGLRALLACLAVASVALAGCGEAAPPKRAVAKITVRPAPNPAASPAAIKRQHIAARVDASSDAALAEGKVHIAAGAPSDAEVRREIKALRKAGIVLPSGDNVESFANGATSTAAAEAQTPETAWNPRLKPIADWIIPVLQWAAAHGWSGTVTSGYRTYYEQAQLNAAGDFSAPAGSSNHETTAYPGGAVDVTNSSQLIGVLRNYPGAEKLIGGVLGPVDPEHFSATGD